MLLPRKLQELILSRLEPMDCNMAILRQLGKLEITALVCESLGVAPTERICSFNRDYFLAQCCSSYESRGSPLRQCKARNGYASFADQAVPHLVTIFEKKFPSEVICFWRRDHTFFSQFSSHGGAERG